MFEAFNLTYLLLSFPDSFEQGSTRTGFPEIVARLANRLEN